MLEQGLLPDLFERDFNDLRRPRGGQIRNNVHCFTNRLDDIRRLQRFLVLGSENGTYRTQDQTLTKDKLLSLDRLIKDRQGTRAVKLIETISVERRNLRHKPLIFALARCARCDDEGTRTAAYKVFPAVCRTPTHLFLFVKFCEEFSAPGSGWGRAHKTAIQKWYLRFSEDPKNLLRILMKYKRREGWTHRDVLRLAHPRPPPNSAINFVFKFITDEQQNLDPANIEGDDVDSLAELKSFSQACIDAKRCTSEEEIFHLIQEFSLSWEHISTEMLNSALVWKALLNDIPVEAFLRNLGRMTRLGVFYENSEEEEIAVAKIANMNTVVEQPVEEDDDDDEIITRKQNIIHPFRIFTALQVYKSSGEIGRGRVTCIPNPNIERALDSAFYRAFQYLVPTNKKCLIAVDVSATMALPVLGMRDINCSMVAAAMMMTFVRTEQNVITGGFATEFTVLDITTTDTLGEVMGKVTQCIGNGGGSDCSAPVKWTMETQNNTNDEDFRDIDAFVIFTTNNNNCGNIHPAEAVRHYREFARNAEVKLIACALCDNDYSIVDQDDWRMMDVVGFDLTLPHAIAEFIKDDD